MSVTAESEPIVILSTPTCVQCKAVERQLSEAGVSYLKVDVSQPGEYRTKMDELGLRSVPQTFRIADADNPDEWVQGFDPDRVNKLF